MSRSALKTFKPCDFFTDAEINKALLLVKGAGDTPVAPVIAKEIIEPVISRIEEKIGGMIDPLYLAYAMEYAIRSILAGHTKPIVTRIPAIGFSETVN